MSQTVQSRAEQNIKSYQSFKWLSTKQICADQCDIADLQRNFSAYFDLMSYTTLKEPQENLTLAGALEVR